MPETCPHGVPNGVGCLQCQRDKQPACPHGVPNGVGCLQCQRDKH